MSNALFETCKHFWRQLTRPVIVNDLDYFNSAWEPHKNEAKKELGTVSASLKTLQEVEYAVGGRNCGVRIKGGFFWHECISHDLHEDIMSLEKTLKRHGAGIVDDPDDVHHIIPPQHSIGYAIHTSQNGRVVCEIVEGLYKRICILREKDLIIAIQPYTMLRHESYGGIHVK